MIFLLGQSVNICMVDTNCLTNYGTPMFVTNNTQVNLITELQLEYKD